ncbi:MAG: hypothetical protein IPJ65_28815 [Archangiaceae bacterium]|nr:hypothetical protein [Archangiaceae bacterium]
MIATTLVSRYTRPVPAHRYAPPLDVVLSELVLFVAVSALKLTRRR